MRPITLSYAYDRVIGLMSPCAVDRSEKNPFTNKSVSVFFAIAVELFFVSHWQWPLTGASRVSTLLVSDRWDKMGRVHY